MVLKVKRSAPRHVAAAERIGRRAGEALRDQGTPARNPFRALDDLARAWARGYVAGSSTTARR